MASRIHETADTFRDLTPASLAIEAAREQGMVTGDLGNMVQDATGVHVIVCTSDLVEDAR